MLAGDPIGAGGLLLGAVRQQGFVAGTVELRTRVVRHAAVHRSVGDAGRPLDHADTVERESRRPDQGSARLEDHAGRLRPVLAQAGEQLAREFLRVGHVLRQRMPDCEPTAEVEYARRPVELLAAATCDIDQPLHCEQALGAAREL